MGIGSLSGIFDTTVDVNNGQSTQTFEQLGDAEFDVSVDGVPDNDPLSVTSSIPTVDYNVNPDFSVNFITVDNSTNTPESGSSTFTINAINNDTADESYTVELYIEGQQVDSANPTIVGNGSETTTLSGSRSLSSESFPIDFRLDVSGANDVDFEIEGSGTVDINLTASTSVNSITQA